MPNAREVLQGPHNNPAIAHIPILQVPPRSTASNDGPVAPPSTDADNARPFPGVVRKAVHRFDPPRDVAQYALAYKQAMGDVLRVIATAANSGPWERCDQPGCPMCDLVLAAQRLAIQVARRSGLGVTDT